MDPCSWRQIDVAFPEWTTSETTALTHLAPLLTSAEDERIITAWFFKRKRPCWRIRYVPRGDRTQDCLHRRLNRLVRYGHIDAATEVIYEPEVHAFGGPRAMAYAHDLFHRDSRHLLRYLASSPDGRHRRELTILLCTVLLRSAGLDWYEQGDVWARVAGHRDPHPIPPERRDALETSVRRLMSIDAGPLTCDGAPLAFATEWATAFTAVGHELADLAVKGLLCRGLRAVLAHHIVFAWNRLGLPYAAQAVLSHTAKQVVFGRAPEALPAREPK